MTIRAGFPHSVAGVHSANRGAPVALSVAKLPASHKLMKVAKPIAQEWLDNNIASSAIGVDVGCIKNRGAISEKSLQTLCVKLLKDGYRHFEEESMPAGTQVTAKMLRGNAAAIAEAAKVVASEGFVYAPENREGRESVQKDVKKIVAGLGAATDIVAVSARTRVHVSVIDDKANVTAFLFANKRTGEYAEFFVREGAM